MTEALGRSKWLEQIKGEIEIEIQGKASLSTTCTTCRMRRIEVVVSTKPFSSSPWASRSTLSFGLSARPRPSVLKHVGPKDSLD
eukprot:14713416-Heterocapsa_arctica.AAC.1